MYHEKSEEAMPLRGHDMGVSFNVERAVEEEAFIIWGIELVVSGIVE